MVSTNAFPKRGSHAVERKYSSKGAFARDELKRYFRDLESSGLVDHKTVIDLEVSLDSISTQIVTKSQIKRLMPALVEVVKGLKIKESSVSLDQFDVYQKFMGELGNQMLPSKYLTPQQRMNRSLICKGQYYQIS